MIMGLELESSNSGHNLAVIVFLEANSSGWLLINGSEATSLLTFNLTTSSTMSLHSGMASNSSSRTSLSRATGTRPRRILFKRSTAWTLRCSQSNFSQINAAFRICSSVIVSVSISSSVRNSIMTLAGQFSRNALHLIQLRKFCNRWLLYNCAMLERLSWLLAIDHISKQSSICSLSLTAFRYSPHNSIASVNTM